MWTSLAAEAVSAAPTADNGMVERFNGRISDVLRTHHFDSSEDLEATLRRYVHLYNHHIPQRALGHRTPIDTLKAWQIERPDLFVKQVYNHPGPDTYGATRFCYPAN